MSSECSARGFICKRLLQCCRGALSPRAKQDATRRNHSASMTDGAREFSRSAVVALATEPALLWAKILDRLQRAGALVSFYAAVSFRS